MTDKFKERVDVSKLKWLYSNNSTARAFLDHAASRQKNSTETSVDRALAVLIQEGHDLSRGQIIEMFRELEAAGCGEFLTGRRGWPSRFAWKVGLVSIGKAAAGEIQEIEEIPAGTPTEEETLQMIPHVYQLRQDLKVTLELPADMTQREAIRLSEFVRSLPFKEQ